MRSVSVPFIWLPQCKSPPLTDQLESLKESYSLISERLLKLFNLGTAALAEEARKTDIDIYTDAKLPIKKPFLWTVFHSQRKCNKGCKRDSFKSSSHLICDFTAFSVVLII